MSCLFDSLSKYLPGTSSNIRIKICDYLKQNNKIIDGMNTRDILNMETSNYIMNMRKNSTWGGAIEIQCACNIWKIRVLVEDKRHKKKHNVIEFLPISNTYNKTIKLNWSGGHYKSS
jgi:hypothetical protein